jgi:hypothetical protein
MSTITENTQTGLIKIEEVTSIMAGAGDVLAKNEKLAAAAFNKGQAYLDTIEGGEMNDDLDKELNEWQVKAKQALEIMNGRRSPITQMMTQIAKVFTGLEGKLDPAKADSVYSKIQVHRNAYAKKKIEAQRAKEAEILKQQNVAKEKIEINSKVESQIREAYQNKLYVFKQAAQDKFNQITLDNISEITEALKGLKMVYPRDKFLELPVNVISLYMDKAELAPVIYEVRTSLYDELSANFRENMEDIQHHLLNLIPSRKLELQEIARADKAKQKELQDAAFLRQQQESKRLQDEADQAKLNDAANVNLKQQIETTGNLFETQAQLAEISEDAGKVRQGYKITVKDMSGAGAIFLFWYEKEGQFKPVDEWMKKTGAQMTAFCEKYAHKNDERIVHKSVVYEEDYKAIATKA